MKTADEVLRALDNHFIHCENCADCPYFDETQVVDCNEQFRGDIRAALEKQIPKSPSAKPCNDTDGHDWQEFFCWCCGNGLGHNRYERLYNVHMESVNDYCENCGQAIEWEGCER